MSAVAMLTAKNPVLQGGLTFAQAMEAHRISNEESLSVPAVAQRMGVDVETMSKLLYGTIWRAARDRWE